MSNNNASNKTHINGRRWDRLTRQAHMAETLSARTMRVEMYNRLQKENHVRTKPRLAAVNATGGFGINRRNKKGGNNA